MNLEKFAKKAGVELAPCEQGWGGKISYRTADAPNCRVCGFRTPNAAYKHWLDSTFGKQASKVVLGLLEKTRKDAA